MTLSAPTRPLGPLAILLILLLGLASPRDLLGQDDHLLTIGLVDSLYSDVLGETREFYIHLPDGGTLRPGAYYPVVYLLDGRMHLGGMAATLDYYGYSHAPAMIVVAISNANHRTRDLTVSAVGSRQGMAVEESGGAEAFTRFLGEELIPYIDRTYPTTPFRTLVGHSYGGLFTINTLLHHTDLFKTYIAIDPSLDWDDQILLRRAEQALAAGNWSGRTLFVSLSNEIPRFSDTMTLDDVPSDTTPFSLGMRSTLEFVDLAGNVPGLRFAWKYYPQDQHYSLPLISLRDGFLFAFDWFGLRSPSLYNDPSTPTERLEALVRARTKRLTENLGYPAAMEEELLSMAGFMAMDAEQFEKARTFFELALEYYPESMDAYDALVDFHLSRADSSKALDYARAALRVQDTPSNRQRVETLSSGDH